MGRILTLNDVAPSGTNLYGYQYTSTGRLSQVTKNGVLYQSYGYDGNGNRTSVTTSTTVDSATCDAQDRLLSYGLLAHGYTRYSYTTSGELTQKVSSSGTSTYSYDELGNLIAAHPAGRTLDQLPDRWSEPAGGQGRERDLLEGAGSTRAGSTSWRR